MSRAPRLQAGFLSDPGLRQVVTALTGAGHQALVVGGAVRNALLGEPVSDIDIATSALPQDCIALAEAAGLRAVPTGIDHGTVTVVAQGRGYEVTTFRRDVATDGRRAVVAYSDRLDEDARRRDFTINALYADLSGRVLDPVGGLADLAARRLRFVGDPQRRIAEDYLRILRFFRFLAWYGREADLHALAACGAQRHGLAGISRERIGHEMRKLLAAPDPAPALALMAEAGVLELVLPGADPGDMADLVQCEQDLGSGALPVWPRRLALLGAKDPGRDLRLSRDEIREQDQIAQALRLPAPEAAYRLGRHAAAQAVLIRAARGQPPQFGWCHDLARGAAARFPLAARDLMPDLTGPELGQALRRAETAWIDSGFELPREELRRIALAPEGNA
ncbi:MULTISPECIES: CCA tRNA nucleotidyltransferase [unclassified Paracoccus (in: a-proteobacteria)]|uniref:CCA tRNA nucleotidyltransferase n=1 Tax=unclassified Paracoccus (in: a-proteobacteria) TaxID=2688777 RepID=UPI0021E10AA7|nr:MULTISPECIES: CCA tRNA nucleotidyltransferase [unclassified Paracoccus (in: a-proteobacteria)]UXU76041.1 CCA tRNA nucleotidyltransferase [Paracoccus sp. SMMA_5]UXU81952.1 CCA tRNA nucleotidyltransferase [Paracoccus sp. SMMA_5_TC]